MSSSDNLYFFDSEEYNYAADTSLSKVALHTLELFGEEASPLSGFGDLRGGSTDLLTDEQATWIVRYVPRLTLQSFDELLRSHNDVPHSESIAGVNLFDPFDEESASIKENLNLVSYDFANPFENSSPGHSGANGSDDFSDINLFHCGQYTVELKKSDKGDASVIICFDTFLRDQCRSDTRQPASSSTAEIFYPDSVPDAAIPHSPRGNTFSSVSIERAKCDLYREVTSMGFEDQKHNTVVACSFQSVPLENTHKIPHRSEQKRPQQHSDRKQCSKCFLTFGRKSDLERHLRTIHSSHHVSHTCFVIGCDNNKGKGYTRVDKLREHQWKKHGELGYRKAGGQGRKRY